MQPERATYSADHNHGGSDRVLTGPAGSSHKLEKYPMQAIYGGWDVAADLQPGVRYDHVVRALGGAGETVEEASDLGPALQRGFRSGVPYLINVMTDPSVAYPRTTALA